ncbi:bifunctional UDP-N-acetylmuramoyl-L-alanyl-D-glutamate--2,6-diaminopimelate ligase MurE/UDP-N-acetylmuramoyl-tripeptide--D-alanyl-D-alanine ligase MurF [Leeia sp.]|uniref:bifunctional UDP-N-acetylmuramoyl-L-alanyl-D-glutamate--2, 6-diaminopimelate ligase MurE/UDP-N-acetylmuramoyl-tripeptide--D-alanyl-D-alanine ligase MurF n=1 Tax=Leeia sp. TaxID=2884678 RepID=UPI0035B1B622
MSMNMDVMAFLRQLPPSVTDLTLDSRMAGPGRVFVAMPGSAQDGRRYIEQAVAAGASAVIHEAEGYEWPAALQVPHCAVTGLRDQLGQISDQWYGAPSQQLSLIGITGTNGKTSCTHWLMQALDALGRKTAVIGTAGNGFAGQLVEAANTTPDAVTLHATLADLLKQGARAVAMEVSSHALEQGRVNGARYRTALFTNLTRDHLDYHGTMAAYGAAKARLFCWPGLQHAVINIDDPFGPELVALARAQGVQVLSYGLSQGDLHCRQLQMGLEGLQLELVTPYGDVSVNSTLLGRFNVANLLGVLGVLLCEGVSLAEAGRVLGRIRSVAGRMQRVGGGVQPSVVVDYSHTPDALENALQTLRDVLPAGGKLYCVFGCGGDRDAGKRPIMGEIAGRLADVAVVTSDNPRTEDPHSIVAQVAAGVVGAHHVEVDRRAAIRHAIAAAQAGDIVLIAGKGNEDYQIIGKTKHHFDDVEEARLALVGADEAAMTTLSMAAEAIGAQLIGNDVAFRHVTHDTRTVQQGSLYVARKGASLDGHALIPDALAAGAVAALVSEVPAAAYACPVLQVADVDLALGKLAAWWRGRFRIPVAGVTGSVGKTTVKEMLAAICAAEVGAEQVLATEGSFNNHTGLPLTLLRLRPQHRFAVIEMGMNHTGEIAYLTGLTRPDVALINNAAPIHLPGVGGTLDGVAAAKGEIFRGLAASGIAVINAADPYADYWSGLNPGRRKVTFGTAQADVHAEASSSARGTELLLHTLSGEIQTCLQVPGQHNVRNAQAATAAALALGISPKAVAAGLAQYQGSKGRLQQKPARFGGRLIDDTYNAQPASMRAALDVLQAMPGKRVFVMGGMGELGEQSCDLHAEVGAYAQGRTDCMLAWGGDTAQACAAFGPTAQHFTEFDALLQALETLLDADCSVLVKGSRAMRMERVVEHFMREA